MRKINLFLVLAFLFSSFPLYALDPFAQMSERDRGMIEVTTPLPQSDVVTITNLKTNFSQNIPSNQIIWVALGEYVVNVKMQEYNYTQTVTVAPTERTDVVVPGFGNLKINPAYANARVQAFNTKTGSLVGEFPPSQIKTVPSGYYDVKITVGNLSVTQNNVWVVTNTTRQIDVKF